MSDTPLTDAKAFWDRSDYHDPSYRAEYVPADLARRLERKLAALRAECEEQARLNGKGAEREAALLGKIERLRVENARLQMELDSMCSAEELRQVRSEVAALRAESAHLRGELVRRASGLSSPNNPVSHGSAANNSKP